MKIENKRDNKKEFIEKYKNMDNFLNEITPFLHYLESTEDEKTVTAFKTVFGIAPNQSVSPEKCNIPSLIPDTETFIDKSIFNFILSLNEHGFQTMASCSGNPIEHLDNVRRGYISFYDTPNCRKFIYQFIYYLEQFDCEFLFEINYSYTYFQESITVYFDYESVEIFEEFFENYKKNKQDVLL